MFVLSIFGIVCFALFMVFFGLTELFFVKAIPKTLKGVGTACVWLIGLDALCIGVLILAREVRRRHHSEGDRNGTR